MSVIQVVAHTRFCAGELSQVPVSRLHSIFGDDTGTWLYHMCRGIDRDVVQPRLAPKSVGCGKSFTAHLQIKKLETVCQLQSLCGCKRRQSSESFVHPISTLTMACDVVCCSPFCDPIRSCRYITGFKILHKKSMSGLKRTLQSTGAERHDLCFM